MEENSPYALVSGLSEGDAAGVRIKLLRLLALQTARLTGGDSSSIREETARELLTSVCFTLGLYLRESGNPPSLLVSADLGELFALGLKTLENRLGRFDRLYETACLGAPDLGNRSFRDTLASLGTFRRRYDYRLFAHLIPCDIDYQLCQPVPETRLGVEYVNDYLLRVILESDFIRRFPKSAVVGLLRSYCPDYRDLLINLFEPVAVNALGLSLLGEDPLSLDIAPADSERLACLLSPLTDAGIAAALRDAAEKLCRSLNIRDASAREYLTRTAEALRPRIVSCLNTGGLQGIFLKLA